MRDTDRMPGEPSGRVTLCSDGVYRWMYEFDMLRNPVILFTIWKIFGIIILAQIALSYLLAVFERGVMQWLTGYLLTPGVLIVPGILLVLSVIAYCIVAGMYGWKYIVLFEMDERGVRHIQEPKQFSKAQGLMWLTAMAGIRTGSPTTAGAGLLASAKSESNSQFSVVRRIKVLRLFHTIKISELLEHNQIYAQPEDFEFVLNYILERCPQAKVSG